MTTSVTVAAETTAPFAKMVEAAAVVAKEENVKPAATKPAKPVTAAKPKAASKGSVAKTETKPAAKKGAATKAAPKAAKGLNFTLMNRPASGAQLYAFTDAVLFVSGLAKGGSANKAQLTNTIGATAIRYHLSKGTMVVNDKGAVVLTAGGKAYFALRAGKFDQAVSDAFARLITTGAIDPLVCKNKDFVTKVAA
jgi:hypothetical protein